MSDIMTDMDTRKIPFAEDRFSTTENLLGFFLFRDSLHHMGEVSFSAMKTYYCGAGCKMCYLKDDWLPRGEMIARNEGLKISPFIEHKFRKIFEIFGTVECLDDLRFIKKTHPDLFDFYKRNGKLIGAPSFTDNALMQQYRIVLDDLDMKRVFQISLSEEFINKRFDKIVEVMGLLVQKYGIIPVFKVIITSENRLEHNPEIRRFIDKVRHLVDKVEVQENIEQETRGINGLSGDNGDLTWDDTYYFENIEGGNRGMYRVLQNFIFLIHDRMYFTFEESIDADPKKACYNLLMDEPSAASMCSQTLANKLATYRRYASEIQFRDNRYFEYFNLIGNSFKVNHDFNFIPAPALEPRFHVVSQLQKEGFVMYKEGYFRNDGRPAKSIIEAIQK
ncbi:hypothetical protein [Ewingella americana]|uniref:Radical SAM protein n=1 Tax=Ewingella americana TaxID=41202 RepID=A0A502GF06_9GAMM|nr:hypothetical protein [Ewingella americana]TPG60118.1 hypothetical protein EAH77_16245 [Ewingella americana]